MPPAGPSLLADRLAWVAALGTGGALALAFPKPDLHLLAWVGLVPLLLAVEGRDAPRAWWLGLLAGIVFRAGTLYWVVPVMPRYGGGAVSWPVAVLAGTALFVYLGAFTAVFAVVAARLGLDRARSVPLLAATWVGLEFVQGRLLGGFPWCLLGYAAGRTTTMMQIADLAGVYGLSFLAVLINAALTGHLVRSRRGRWTTGAVGIAVGAAAVYGVVVLAMAPAIPADTGTTAAGSGPPEGESSPAPAASGGERGLRVALVQGNVPQGRKWDPDARREILERHLRLSRRGAAEGAALIVWPEASIPNPYGIAADPEARASLAELARETGAAILFGSPYVARGAGERYQTNAAFLMGPRGDWLGRYDKIELVPFGEYVPFDDWLDLLGPLVVAVADFRPGDPGQPPLAAPEADVSPFGVAICYEIVFPELMRRQAERGARFLVTITNDAWYADSSAPFQHFAMARMRAVELRRTLVRAANTGISGVVDPWGRVRARLGLNRTGVLVENIRLARGTTPFQRTGILFPLACALLSAGAFAVEVRGGRRGTEASGAGT